MIHAYNEYYLPFVEDKMANIFELAILYEHIDLEEFVIIFLKSRICKAIENADPIYVLGKSPNELLALILNQEPKEYIINSFAPPENWVGYALAYVSWYLNMPFKDILSKVSITELINCYFPYHEMDIMLMVDYVKKRVNKPNTLKSLRSKLGYSQSDLAALSGVPIRNIRAYEQETHDIANASAKTLYEISKVLGCSMEDLLK